MMDNEAEYTLSGLKGYTQSEENLPSWEVLYQESFDVKSLTLSQCKEIAAACWKNPHHFAKFFFPSLVPKRMPWLHKGILAITTKQVEWLESDPEVEKIVRNFVYERDGEVIPLFVWLDGKLCLNLERYTMFMIPRGYAKTTIVGIITPLYLALFNELKVAMYVSATATHANTQLSNQKKQLESNERILYFFGNLKPSMQDSAPWREDVFETTTGVTMVARGRGGQVRGYNYNGQRPQKILVDDLEDKDQVATPEGRTKLKDWMYGDLMPCLPAMEDGAELLVMGTLIHADSLLTTLMIDPAWNVVKFGAYDRDGELLWPENMDADKLRKAEDSATIAGTLSSFYMERHSEIRATKDADFKLEYLQYGGPAADEELFQTLYVDPAISAKATADSCTFTVVANSSKGCTYVRHSSGGTGISPRDQVNKIFELYLQYKPDRVGVESNAYQIALVHLAREEMFRRKVYFEIIPVNNTDNKKLRIKGILQPRYAGKFVWHEGRFVSLEQQLLLFPANKKDDYADGCAGAMSLLDDAAFMAENTGATGSESPDLVEVIGGTWRSA
jgi:hypothetical protein